MRLPKQYVVIAGAGISMAPPSNLPSWWQYNLELITAIKEQASVLCPEAASLLALIDPEKNLPVQCISDLIVGQGAGESYFPLLKVLNSTKPNANHLALADLARRGLLKAIVTTNFDTLIEAAFMQEAVPLLTVVQDDVYYEAPAVPACRLFKIHGSVGGEDYDALIDTVRQKAVGLSPAKRAVLDGIFQNSEILVLGFSGADLDFDLDYIPLSRALDSGSKVTWILQPGSHPNHNVEQLAEKYPHNFFVHSSALPELFQALGVDYQAIDKHLPKDLPDGAPASVLEQARALFAADHIGPHGCVGYCISLLNMVGEHAAASELAALYETKINLTALNVSSILGISALAYQKMLDQKFEDSKKYHNAVINCLLYMQTLSNQAVQEKEGAISDKLRESQRKETLTNLSTSYNNLAVISLYENEIDEAGEYLLMAKKFADEAGAVGVLCNITFNLARVDYRRSDDFDQYLPALQVAAEYARRAGQLRTLVEILLEECSVRLYIGEYYLANKILEECSRHLQNVGNRSYHDMAELLRSQYRIRVAQATGSSLRFPGDMPNLAEIKNQLPESIAKILPDDPRRQLIIYLEYTGERAQIPALFSALCGQYVSSRKWERLRDTAVCLFKSTDLIKEKSVAQYYFGCADLETNRYSDAMAQFQGIIHLGAQASPLHVGWSYIELGKLHVKKGDLETGEEYYRSGKRILQSQCTANDAVDACISYILVLLSNGYTETADILLCAMEKSFDDPALQEKIRGLRESFEEKKQRDETPLDASTASPESIATEALRLHDTGEAPKRAWELIRIAKERYQANGNWLGVGRCENNMGCFCIEEGSPEEATAHFLKAIEIKRSLGDLSGTANDLTTVLLLYLKDRHHKEAGDIADYAAAHLPEYSQTEDKYRLFYALFQYYIQYGRFAEALSYAKQARAGVEFLTNMGQDIADILDKAIQTIEAALTCQNTPPADADPFEEQMLEAIRLYQSNHFSDSCRLLDCLLQEADGDPMKMGIIKGTFGNAYLHEKKYEQAIEAFQEARQLFSQVAGSDSAAAREHKFTALNGIVLSLDGLGRTDESMHILRRELADGALSNQAECSLTLTLCNRLLRSGQDRLRKDDPLFAEILGMLDRLKVRETLPHEMRGALYTAFGGLYAIVDEKEEAIRYYKLAKKEFITVNSPHLAEVNQMLNRLAQ